MMKKFFALILSLLLMTSGIVFAEGDNKNFLDPFNNDLFEIVTEIDIPDELVKPSEDWGVMFFPTRFEYYINTPASQSDRMNRVKVNVAYDGSVTSETVLAEATYAEIDDYKPEVKFDVKEGEYNDGLTFSFRTEEVDYYDEYFSYTIYQDVNGKQVFEGIDTFHSYVYNMGLMQIVEYGDYVNGDEYDCTSFIDILGDGTRYDFKGNISSFNDDGYAIMDVNLALEPSLEDKFYIVKLKKGFIPTVKLDGEKILFDQIPVIEDGRTLVPVRSIFEKIGATVGWNPDTRTVTAEKDGTKIQLTIDDTNAFKNEESIRLDVPAKIIGGRTMVPLRFISDCFGVDVEWDGSLKQVCLSTKK